MDGGSQVDTRTELSAKRCLANYLAIYYHTCLHKYRKLIFYTIIASTNGNFGDSYRVQSGYQTAHSAL